MRRPPLWPSVLVGLAVATMIALGIWQLERRAEKAEALSQYRANLTLPETAYPARDSTDASYLFRTVSLFCLRVVDWQTVGGRLPGDRPGWRHIATCVTGIEGLAVRVDVGTGADPKSRPRWTGGAVSGVATWAPDSGSALGRWLGDGAPRELMVVAARPAPGLAPSPRPDPAGVPDNHLAYAVQWFLFAGVAVIIYVLALRRRSRGPADPLPPAS